jgi:DNA-binding NarL/FixJ family response regulator
MASLDENEDGETQIGATGSRRRIEPQRLILILTNTGSVSDLLIDAIEREFPRIVVEQVDHIDAACAAFPHPVALMLVDFAFLRQAEAASASFRRTHPQALAAVILSDEKDLAVSLTGIADSPLIRSILPMDLRLDIWLSIIRLMLCGGQYFPPEAMIQTTSNGLNARLVVHENIAPVVQGRERNTAVLTARETQILEMAAQGLQNKLIAAEFRLSEHTVKVHLHNIIRKLGVHNRTEAAARFRSSLAAIGYE